MTAEEKIDKLLNRISGGFSFNFDNIFFNEWGKNMKTEQETEEIKLRMVDEKLIEKKEDDSLMMWFRISPRGREINNSGGYLKYLDDKAKEKKMQSEKLKYDLKVSKRMAKWYWFWVILSIIGSITGIVSLIRSFIK